MYITNKQLKVFPIVFQNIPLGQTYISEVYVQCKIVKTNKTMLLGPLENSLHRTQRGIIYFTSVYSTYKYNTAS